MMKCWLQPVYGENMKSLADKLLLAYGHAPIQLCDGKGVKIQPEATSRQMNDLGNGQWRKGSCRNARKSRVSLFQLSPTQHEKEKKNDFRPFCRFWFDIRLRYDSTNNFTNKNQFSVVCARVYQKCYLFFFKVKTTINTIIMTRRLLQVPVCVSECECVARHLALTVISSFKWKQISSSSLLLFASGFIHVQIWRHKVLRSI